MVGIRFCSKKLIKPRLECRQGSRHLSGGQDLAVRGDRDNQALVEEDLDPVSASYAGKRGREFHGLNRREVAMGFRINLARPHDCKAVADHVGKRVAAPPTDDRARRESCCKRHESDRRFTDQVRAR